MAVQDGNSKPYRIAGSQTDITERKASEARLIHNAMGVDRESAEIVQTIVTLARNLGIYVVAEGVETAAQLSQLRTMNCKNG